jgi:hypothetical protein
MNLLQLNGVLEDEQQRLCPPSNDLTLQDPAGIDRQLEEERSAETLVPTVNRFCQRVC